MTEITKSRLKISEWMYKVFSSESGWRCHFDSKVILLHSLNRKLINAICFTWYLKPIQFCEGAFCLVHFINKKRQNSTLGLPRYQPAMSIPFGVMRLQELSDEPLQRHLMGILKINLLQLEGNIIDKSLIAKSIHLLNGHTET